LLSNNQCAAGHKLNRDRIKSIAVAAILLPLSKGSQHVTKLLMNSNGILFVITLKNISTFRIIAHQGQLSLLQLI
jgi:hypothetical protein